MAPLRKNIMVGLTVLVALILFGVLLLKFGAAPAKLFGGVKVPIEMYVARADGLSPGSSINYLGVNVGQVTEVRASDDATHVIITASIDARRDPPANVQGVIRSQIVGGGSNVSLEIPEGQKPEGKLKPGAKVPAKFVGLDLVPPEVGQLATELRLTAQQLRESHLVDHLDETIQTVNVQLQKAGKLVDTIDNTVHDAQVQENLRASLENVRKATEQANRIGTNLEKFSGRMEQMGDRFDHVAQSADTAINKTQAHIDDLAKQMSDRMEQAAKLLAEVQSITSKVDGGKGTAGMLVNDPKLYEGLVDASKELSGVLRDLKLLVEQIREEGFPLRLGK